MNIIEEGTSSEDENDLMGGIESDLFNETSEDRYHSEKAKNYLKQIAKRTWGLAHRDKYWKHGSLREGSLVLSKTQTIYFQETLGQQQRVWDCSLILSKFLTNFLYFKNNFWNDKVVLELGCGIGVPGICAHTLGALEVYLTDMSSAVPWIQHNIDYNESKKNSCTDKDSRKIDAIPLEWNDNKNPLFEKKIDIVLCSDLLNGTESVVELLVSTIQKLCHSNSIVIFCHESRVAGASSEEIFFKLMDLYSFKNMCIPHESLDNVYTAENINIHLFSYDQNFISTMKEED